MVQEVKEAGAEQGQLERIEAACREAGFDVIDTSTKKYGVNEIPVWHKVRFEGGDGEGRRALLFLQLAS